MTRHLRSLLDLNADEFERILLLSAKLKQDRGAYATKLAGKSLALIFSKSSTRTRVSFEVGIHQLGGQPLFLNAAGSAGLQVSRGETHYDTAKVMSRYVDGLIVRTFHQAHVDSLAEHGSIPVINALTDACHPCQALADVLTMREKLGDVRGKKLVFVGPGNNVTSSLLLAATRAGFNITCACPETLPPDPKFFEAAQGEAAAAGVEVTIQTDPHAAMAGADAIYTDTWVSMGQEELATSLKALLQNYVVNDELMALANPGAIFMHCLPAHRGEEVMPSVIDGPQSVIFDEAENRLHTQKALMLLLLGAEPWS